MKQNDSFILACVVVFFAALLAAIRFWPEGTRPYNLGQDSIRKEAFERGFMVKKIGEDDKVIYEWIENKP